MPKVCTEQTFSLTQENNETLPISFKRSFFFQHYLLPFHPPQTQVQNGCTSPRREGLLSVAAGG